MAHTPLVVSSEALATGDAEKVACSNCDFVFAQRQALLRDDEVHPDALRSDSVEWYVGQCLKGGFSQFLYNSRGRPSLIDCTRDGLRSIGALRHLAHYDRLIQAFCGQPALENSSRPARILRDGSAEKSLKTSVFAFSGFFAVNWLAWP